MEEAQVGKYFKDKEGRIWRMISYCSSPTALMENVATGEQTGGAVGSLNLSGFSELSEEAQAVAEEMSKLRPNYMNPPYKNPPKGMLEVRDPASGKFMGYMQAMEEENVDIATEKVELRQPVKYCDNCDCGKAEGCK